MTAKRLVMPFPLTDEMAYLDLPIEGITKHDAEQLCAMVRSLPFDAAVEPPQPPEEA